MNHDRDDLPVVDADQKGSNGIDNDNSIIPPPAVAVPPNVTSTTISIHIPNDEEEVMHTNFQQPRHPFPSPPLPGNPALLHYYQAQMRDHAAAYASAASAAAMMAAQIAADMGNLNYHYQSSVPTPPMLPSPPMIYPTYLPQNSVSPYTCSNPTSSFQPLQSGEDNFNNGRIDNTDNYPDEMDENHGTGHQHCRRRRKQQRRMPPSDSNNNRNDDHSNGLQREVISNSLHFCPNTSRPESGIDNCPEHNYLQQQGNQNRGRRRRRFSKSAGGSSDPDNSDVNFSRNRRRNHKLALAASSSSDGSSASFITKKKQRQPNDDILLGLTGVAALYEWCLKRRVTPNFVTNKITNYYRKKDSTKKSSDNQRQLQHSELDEDSRYGSAAAAVEESKRRRLELDNIFETTVSIDGVEMGTGSGHTKASSKHEASRRALHILLPGVHFDFYSGILIRLPGALTKNRQSKSGPVTSLEDLAPNLAKQLAIGHDDNENMKTEVKKERVGKHDGLVASDARKRQQKVPYFYPKTTLTNSDDEDENSYYESRGASAVFSTLLHAMVQIDERLTEPPTYTYRVLTMISEKGEHSKLKRKAGIPIEDTSTTFPRGSFQCTGMLKLQINADATETDDTDLDSIDGSTSQPRECYQVLRSFAVGGTKREARHTATAKLLAMLFPDCVGMISVKQAAEAARERYAEKRLEKHLSKTREKSDKLNREVASNFLFESLSKKRIELPEIIKNGLLSSLESVETSASIYDQKCKGLARQLSRQQQLKEKIDAALQKLNEHDDEGRSLPEELTVDDVGRTVLRRAKIDDVCWVKKLFGTKRSLIDYDAQDLSPLSLLTSVSNKEPNSKHLRLWSSSTIVLLLCRAFHEEPPLGCAVLTLGFSMQKGKIIRIAQIASKPHQPRERFIETLSHFAKYMECVLISSTPKPSFATLRKDSIQEILTNPEHVSMKTKSIQVKEEEETYLRYNTDRDSNLKLPSPIDKILNNKTSLQCVQEEGEGLEDSDSSAQNDTQQEKRNEKPNKRSRFE